MRLDIVNAPSAEVFTTAYIKNILKLDSTITTDDTYIDNLIKAVKDFTEGHCKRALITQDWKMTLDSCEIERMIEIPLGYLQSITSVNIVADDGTKTLQSSSTIYNTKTEEFGRIYLKEGATWTTTTRVYDSMEIVFKVGYGDAGSNVPEGIKTGMEQIITKSYFHRANGTRDKDNITVITPSMALEYLNKYQIVII